MSYQPTPERCNICGYPDTITIRNPESGRQEQKRMDCIGHQGIPFWAWSRHPEHHRWRKYQVSLGIQESETAKETRKS